MDNSNRSEYPIWVRAGLGMLTVQIGVLGTWQLVGSASFHQDFPGLGRHWVAAFPPYNEHLLTDVGGLNLGFALLFLWATLVPDRRVARAGLGAFALSAVLHLGYHLGRLSVLEPVDQVAQTIALALTVALPVALVHGLRRQETAALK